MNNKCRYGSCLGGEACLCEMEREAVEETRQAMRMLACVLIYAAVMAGLIAIVWIL